MMRRLLTLAFMLLAAVSASADDCRQAERLVKQAFELGSTPETFLEQKRLLTRALDLCPDSANAHNILGSIFEAEGHDGMALKHYQTAARLRPDFAAAWFGAGEIYYKSGRFPLALEAYLHACPTDKDARARIRDLLAHNRYQTAADGAILEKESLLLLFDRSRRAELQRLLDGCRTRAGGNFGMRGVLVEPTADFPNILFDLGKATLKTDSFRQIEEIAATLQELKTGQVIVSGHTDKQPFAGVTSAEENLRLNRQLSQERAAAVARILIRRGIAASRIKTRGYGPTQPLIDKDTPEAYARNRRVAVEVR
ncbi:hypothetical protein CSA56_00295 [candidate division KSB3 bacterium]|uniref:OmpA-like domain-containing protein n=1 Tax=candidate division KSB3 bacterium TaxID=2044937 RepID=A0A2G6KLE8_9BACT|nr:MAG: hypothetical protein CSA56_00295 [candidate division KSB3 bacterium]